MAAVVAGVVVVAVAVEVPDVVVAVDVGITPARSGVSLLPSGLLRHTKLRSAGSIRSPTPTVLSAAS